MHLNFAADNKSLLSSFRDGFQVANGLALAKPYIVDGRLGPVPGGYHSAYKLFVKTFNVHGQDFPAKVEAWLDSPMEGIIANSSLEKMTEAMRNIYNE